MAIERDNPYGAFNYQVTITPKSGLEISAAFSDVSGLETTADVAEYRDGTDPRNRPRKVITGYKVGDVTLKRGLIGKMDLWKWIEEVRTGQQEARATVVIELMSENHADSVATWRLENVQPTKWTGPTLAAKAGTDLAMEELTLACEDIFYE